MADFDPAGYLQVAEKCLESVDAATNVTFQQGLIRATISRAYYAAFLSAYKHLAQKDECPLVVFDDAIDLASHDAVTSKNSKNWAAQAIGTRRMHEIWEWKYKKGSHQFVIAAFVSRNKPRAIVNTLLDSLQKLRITADYRLRKEIKKGDATTSCSLARQILEQLATLPPDHCNPCDNCKNLDADYQTSLRPRQR